jgi:hypothetical protein
VITLLAEIRNLLQWQKDYMLKCGQEAKEGEQAAKAETEQFLEQMIGKAATANKEVARELYCEAGILPPEPIKKGGTLQ